VQWVKSIPSGLQQKLGLGSRGATLSTLLICLAAQASEGTTGQVQGSVLDTNGNPIPKVMVTVNAPARESGRTGISVFSDENGHFAFPDPLNLGERHGLEVRVKSLGYEALPITIDLAERTKASDIVLVMRPTANQAAVAPASAWLRSIPNNNDKSVLISACISCHQMPTPEVRAFAVSLNDVRGADPDHVRDVSWHTMTKVMRFRFAKALGRGFGFVPTYDDVADPASFWVTTPKDEETFVKVLKDQLPRHFDTLENYDHGAPLAVTDQTIIREYTVPGPNGIREAVLAGQPKQLWVVDFTRDMLVRIDPDSGELRDYPVPFEGATGPHTPLLDRDKALWVSMTFNSRLGKFDPTSGEWRIWPLTETPEAPIVVHDLAYDSRFELAPDSRGHIWFTDIGNNALGVFDPATGETESHPAPGIPDRSAGAVQMYSLLMTSDRRYVWYTQLWGYFGCFDTKMMKYETVVEVPIGSGPRRPAITEKDILYVPLFGAGQIVEYDTLNRRQLGIYDLPDRASAPYAVTWDQGRQVLWVVTANADVIYRFDPKTKTFGVIPLPQPKTFLRSLFVDPDNGWLVTSAGNLPETTDGPRTALVIDPGDSTHNAISTRKAR
jgi:virginiamycin B lyase